MTEHTRRELRNITRHALHRLATAPDDLASEDTRETARAALAQLDGRDSRPDPREPYVARWRVQPGLWLTVDASHNIMLEVRSTDEAELLAAYPLTDTARLGQLLELARVAATAVESGDLPGAIRDAATAAPPADPRSRPDTRSGS